MNISGPKNRVTLRRLGQRRDVPKNFICKVATLGPTSRGCKEA